MSAAAGIGVAAPPPEAVVTEADAIARASPWRETARAAALHAPYLARVMRRRPDLITDMDADWARRTRDAAIDAARSLAAAPGAFEAGMAQLRRAKDALHLATALGDLSRDWTLDDVTGALTHFADESLRAAVALAAQLMGSRGEIAAGDFAAPQGPFPGVTFIAMGKMGAGELNYSSDIDFSVFYEPDALPLQSMREARAAALRLVQHVVKALEAPTEDGYVFRTDLRLRPDPASTPPAVTIAAAEIYYQSLGQNWERAAFIKARAAAGDAPLGAAFLKDLEPYIWRRNLDFAAVSDVHSIKRQILSAHGSADLGDPVFDVKLGRGGIRDIELHAQTQQLIFGGRNKRLRAKRTLDALAGLEEAGAIDATGRAGLADAYVLFRETEHRIQMLEDAQTHKVPAAAEARARVAALAGFGDVSAFEAALVARRRIVSDVDHRLFGRFESLADPMGSLIFTGVEDDPETLATIGRLGFKAPGEVAATIRGWHHGRVRAMRSERAREILTKLTPRLLRAIAETDDPDLAFRRFAIFFSALPAGVQVLSLFQAQPKFLDEIMRALTLAPKLAEELARRPALLDAMIEERFDRPLSADAPEARRAFIHEALEGASSFEDVLNAARRVKREEAFRIGMQVLSGRADAEAAGAAHADLAEALVEALAGAALGEVERAHGAQPGRFAVLALGKFGGRELSEGSDLDVMLVYDAAEEARSAGPRALSPVDFYARVTQRLISALSAPTEEGTLYDVDMQLRPSGSKGPVAVRLSSFARYYTDEAWTWELLALTRLRPIAGDARLGAEARAIAEETVRRPRAAGRVLGDVADMRLRMERERPARGVWDLKLAPGGFVDVEFIAQTLQLLHAPAGADVLAENTGAALEKLRAAGFLEAEHAETLHDGWALSSRLQQALRICVEGEFAPEEAPAGLRALLARAAGEADFPAAEARLQARQTGVRALFQALIAAPATEAAGLGVEGKGDGT